MHCLCMPRLPYSLLRFGLSPHKAHDVVEGGKDHERYEQGHAHAHAVVQHLGIDGSAEDDFPQAEEGCSAVKDRYGQKVQDAKVDADVLAHIPLHNAGDDVLLLLKPKKCSDTFIIMRHADFVKVSQKIKRGNFESFLIWQNEKRTEDSFFILF